MEWNGKNSLRSVKGQEHYLVESSRVGSTSESPQPDFKLKHLCLAAPEMNLVDEFRQGKIVPGTALYEHEEEDVWLVFLN